MSKLITELGASPGLLTPDQMRAKCQAFLDEFNKWVLGYPEIGMHLLIAHLMPNKVKHIYAQGMPGLAKTHVMETVARIISDIKFKRIQCHSDLTPSQIVGSQIYNPAKRIMELAYGELVGNNLILADEGNRATPDTQAAFLQAMAEGKVSLTTLPEPIKMEELFVILMTANPAEQKGVYPLPEAQLDRFLFWLNFGYVKPVFAKEMHLRPELSDGSCYDMIKPQMTRQELLAISRYIKEHIYVSPAFVDYMYAIVSATRPGEDQFNILVKNDPEASNLLSFIKVGEEWGGGAGPRGEQCLLMAAKIYAFLYGEDKKTGAPRDYVQPSDLNEIVKAILRARIMLKDEAKYPDPKISKVPVTTVRVIEMLMNKVQPVGGTSDFQRH